MSDEPSSVEGVAEADGQEVKAPSAPVADAEPTKQRSGKSKTNGKQKSGDAAKDGPAQHDGLPYGYKINSAGLWFEVSGEPAIWICDELFIRSECRSEESESWSLVVEFTNRDGVKQMGIVSRADASSDGINTIRRELSSKGFRLSNSRPARERFADFICRVTVRAREVSISRGGWHGDGQTFATPAWTVAKDGALPVVFERAPRGAKFSIKGSLEEWKATVAVPVYGHELLMFFLAIGLTGPLLDPLGFDGGGFHLVGPSSVGKTTTLLVPGSLWGGGGPLGFLQSWRTTSNGLEGTCAAHNDSCLCADEIGQIDPRDLFAAIYLICGGEAKARSKSDGEVRARNRWRIAVASTGETSIAARIAESGARAMGGQGVRVIDLYLDGDSGVFSEAYPKEDLPALANKIREAALTSYGTAGRVFVERMIHNRADFIKITRALIAEFLVEHVPPGASGQVARVGRRFALVAAAGELAIMYEVLPWAQRSVYDAAGRLFSKWLARRGGMGASEDFEAIAVVRNFLQLHGASRFVPIDMETSWRVQLLAGYKDTTGGFYYLNDAGWREALGALEPRLAADAIARAGFLIKDAEGRRKVNMKVQGKTQRLYKIKGTILEGAADAR
ncbi:DUF927 domain-containing protein [Methylocapsa polymorpha]|uniref:DUF927 domain-containing protein n=1 Tax=Methylocapsa polymorpha TaxID=3080828 RepID=A0ABZ0HUH3_9HYPH|nr:DUF927 domain-containing protein [Methylocapsa sp. RX1]